MSAAGSSFLFNGLNAPWRYSPLVRSCALTVSVLCKVSVECWADEEREIPNNKNKIQTLLL